MMNRHPLSVAQLEDRTTPAGVKLTVTVAPASASTPPQDPMDNPPPSQPGTPSNPGQAPSPGSPGGSTGPTIQVSAKVAETPAFTVAFVLPTT